RIEGATGGADGWHQAGAQRRAKGNSALHGPSSARLLSLVTDEMVFAPARQHVLRNLQQIEDACDDEIHQVVEGLWLMIEAWRSRQDHRAQIRQLEHVFQVDARIGGLARHQDQLARSEEHTSELQSRENLVC